MKKNEYNDSKKKFTNQFEYNLVDEYRLSFQMSIV